MVWEDTFFQHVLLSHPSKRVGVATMPVVLVGGRALNYIWTKQRCRLSTRRSSWTEQTAEAKAKFGNDPPPKAVPERRWPGCSGHFFNGALLAMTSRGICYLGCERESDLGDGFLFFHHVEKKNPALSQVPCKRLHQQLFACDTSVFSAS